MYRRPGRPAAPVDAARSLTSGIPPAAGRSADVPARRQRGRRTPPTGSRTAAPPAPPTTWAATVRTSTARTHTTRVPVGRDARPPAVAGSGTGTHEAAPLP